MKCSNYYENIKGQNNQVNACIVLSGKIEYNYLCIVSFESTPCKQHFIMYANFIYYFILISIICMQFKIWNWSRIYENKLLQISQTKSVFDPTLAKVKFKHYLASGLILYIKCISRLKLWTEYKLQFQTLHDVWVVTNWRLWCNHLCNVIN